MDVDPNVRRERPALPGILLAAGLTLALLLWFGRACWGGWWLDNAKTSSDTYLLALLYERWAVQVADGHLPLWFPEFACGYPVHAAWMYGLAYPPLLLFAVLPPESAWTWLSLLHIVFGGIGMWRFLRDDGHEAAGAASGAVVFALSEFMVGRILAGHVNLVMPFAWAPWVLLAANRTVRGERGAAAWLGIAAGAFLVAGHVQMAFYVAPVVAAYAIALAARRGVLRQAAPRLALAAAIALGIAVIQSVPAWELFDVSGHPREERDVMLGCSAPVSALVAQIAPRLVESSERFAHEFSGLGGPLAVAATLLAIRLRDRRRLFWASVVLLGLVLAMGFRNPVSEFANDLPPFRWARAAGRALSLVVLGGSVLTASFVADWFGWLRGRWRAAIPAAFGVSALALGVSAPDVVRSDFYEFDWASALPGDARDHRVHVRFGRYPYVERSGVRTIRDLCPLDMPGYKALVKKPSAAVAWWVDVRTELLVPWHGSPPVDRLATEENARESAFDRFVACGPAQVFESVGPELTDAEVLERMRSGERTLYVHAATPEIARHRGGPPAAPRRAAAVERPAPSEIEVDAGPDARGVVFVPAKWYPGWRRRTAGGAGWEDVSRANLAFIAVEAAPGRVLLAYRPWWKWPAILVCLGSLGAALVLGVRRAAK